MARKKVVSSYSEKLLYDNTIFYGINSIAVSNSEGYFKHLVNFDTDASYQSLTPRQGWLLTCLYDTDNISLNLSSTLAFKSANDSEYKFIDFNKTTYSSSIYKVPMYYTTNGLVVESKKINCLSSDCQLYGSEELYLINYLADKHDLNPTTASTQIVNIIKSFVIENKLCEYIKDSYTIDRYINKVYYSYANTTYYIYLQVNDTGDTPYITVVDLDNIESYSSTDRNIASSKSIISQYLKSSIGIQTYNSVGMIFVSNEAITVSNNTIVEQDTTKWLLTKWHKNTYSDLYLYPSFYLATPDTGKKWAYTFTITSTSADILDTDNLVFDSPVYDLLTNNAITTNGNNLIRANYPSATGSNYNELYKKYITLAPYVDIVDSESISTIGLPVIYAIRKPNGTKLFHCSHINNTDCTVIESNRGDINYDIATTVQGWYPDVTASNISRTNILQYVTGYSGLSLTSKTLNCNYFNSGTSTVFSRVSNYEKLLKLLNNGSFDDYRFIIATDTTNSWGDSCDMAELKSSINSNIMITTKPLMTATELYEEIKNKYDSIILKVFTNSITLNITKAATIKMYPIFGGVTWFNHLFNGIFDNYTVADTSLTSSSELIDFEYTCTVCCTLNLAQSSDDDIVDHLFYVEDTTNYNTVYPAMNCPTKDTTIENYNPNRSILEDNDGYPDIYYFANNIYKTNSITSPFTFVGKNNSSPYSFYMQTNLSTLKALVNPKNDETIESYFKEGIIFSVQLNQVNTTIKESSDYDTTAFNAGSSLILSTNITTVNEKDDMTFMTNTVDEYSNILNSTNRCVFNSEQGYRLVIWYKNKVYMSEAGDYNWFKEDNVKTYSSAVIKVIPYQNLLIVFTTDTVYAIFPYEVVSTVSDGTDSEGNAKTTQVTTIYYNTLPVLYNIMCEDKYKDVIQIYNKMILFYSAEGHLYVITPSTTIDSDTEWTLKLLNQAADDILLNYIDYMNDRLVNVYDEEEIPITSKNDIKISADVTLETIKIRYAYKNYLYELILDTTKTRFTVYDTMCCTYDYGKLYKDSFLTSRNNNLTIFTKAPITYSYDSNADLYTSDFNMWEQKEICCEINTGIITLNNQWKKRFRNLRITYKNLDTHKIKYDLAVLVDDVYINTCMSDTIELKNILGSYASETVNNGVDVLENNSVLFDFMDYHSNKLITHTTTIPALGRYINLVMRFKSKGKYKIQLFELTYKEHGI